MIGCELGAFRLLAELGAGGMGTVYLATATRDCGEVAAGGLAAVKVVHPHLIATPGFFKRFLREAEVGRAVRHENVVRTYEADATLVGGQQVNYLVMEYVEGRTLRDMLGELHVVPEGLLREIAGQIAAGLAAIHAKGIIHRDLKPENVISAREGARSCVVKIMDLGLARIQEVSLAITREGQFAGSLLYAAPEQFRGEPVGPASDLYSLGVILYELASGLNPFQRADAAQVIAAHLNVAPAPLRSVGPGVSPFLGEVAAHLLAKDPRARLASAADLRDLLASGESGAWWTCREGQVRRQGGELPSVEVRRDAPIVGRAREMSALDEAWRDARDGRGGVVLIEGEDGIGKTRVVEAFLRSIGGEVAHALYGAGAGGLASAVVERFGRGNLAAAVRPYLGATAGLSVEFAGLIARQPRREAGTQLNEDVIETVYCNLAHGLSAEGPVAWVVDDFHLAADAERRSAAAIARIASSIRLLLVVCTRPIPADEITTWRRVERIRRLPVPRLSRSDVGEMLRETFRSPALAERLAPQVAERSDGVPFVALEIVRALYERGLVQRLPDGRSVETQPIVGVEAPSIVKTIFEARLARISPEARAILDAASVLGFEFDADLVARMLDTRRIVVLRALAELERGPGLVRAVGRRHRFDHHQLREVVYERLPISLREEYHDAAADCLVERDGFEGAETAVKGATACHVVAHRLAGTRPESARRLLDCALDHLEWAQCGDDLVDLIGRALAAPGVASGSARAELLLRLAGHLDPLGRHEEERAALNEALKLADASANPSLRARARVAVAWRLLRNGQDAEVGSHVAAALDLARTCGDRRIEASAVMLLGNAACLRRRLDEARTRYEEVTDLAREIRDARLEAAAGGNLALVLWNLCDFSEAERQYGRAITLSHEVGDRRGEAAATGNLGLVMASLGRFEAALSQQEQSRNAARTIGDRRTETAANAASGRLLHCMGALEEARERLECSADMARAIGDRRIEAQSLQALADLADESEDMDAAATFERAAGEARRDSGAGGEAEALLARGTSLARRGRASEARAALGEAHALAVELDLATVRALAVAHLQCLGGYGAVDTLPPTMPESQFDARTQLELRFLAWRSTGDIAALLDAKARLDALVASAPVEYRESMRGRVRLHREIDRAAAQT